MKLIKGVFLAGLLLVLVAAGAFAMYNRGAFNNINIDTNQLTALTDKLPNQVSSLLPQSENTSESKENESSESNISFDQESAKEQVKVLTDRSQEVSEEVSKVLGDFIQVNENDGDEALHERALEYGQYLYCMQVVEQYEKENPPEEKQ